jgi:hypothetical protein
MELGAARSFRLADREPVRSRRARRRPWGLLTALGALLLLAALLGLRLAGMESEAERLRAELRGVYAETESLRTRAVQAEQRTSLLEQQLQQLRGERESILRQLQVPKREGSRPAAAQLKQSGRAKFTSKPATTISSETEARPLRRR